ncbi:FAD-binding domain-containing protein [Desarmillaria tabescens]|uniref:FAD-binding domain-containing protein n=1 Tax=Armillaria tabescens TaxID=1929756 RepID=A0AA39N5E3_ARMTA|nr:FAD-binding domain-containing protein [Desarmillaria tabescens]KAK0458567.1 FAD-binding domain-containing protein [Desarmillaria tabescens]
MFSGRLFVFSVLCWPVFAVPTANDWQNLADSLNGRLHTALPFASSCFSTVNGISSTPNETECAQVQADYTNATVRSSHFSAYTMPQWETCQRTSKRCLLDPSNTSNPAAFEGSDCLQGSVSYTLCIDVQSAEDVQKAYEFSKATGIPLSIKASGHDYKGRSSLRGSLSLWTRNIGGLKYSADFVPEGGDKSYRAITMGAGVTFQDVYEFADANNVTIIGAYHQTAADGLWRGGGHSVLTPVYGLGVDRVLQFKIVTPDGELRVANEFQHPDLFWALRGGGGSTFGVVLESSMLVEPRMSLTSAAISFPQTAENGVSFLKLLVDHTYRWGTEGWGGHMRSNGIINVNPLLTLEEAQVSVQPIVDYALAQNGTAVVEELPSWMAFFTKYVLSAEAAKTTLGSRLIPTDKFTTDSGKARLLDILTRMVQQFSINPYIVFGTPFLYNHTEGSTSVTPAWRNALWHMSSSRTFSWNSTAIDMWTQYEFVSTITQSLREFSLDSGVYLNECDVYEPNHEEAFWGANYARLVPIKKQYDPFHLLDCWMYELLVGWKGSLDERYSCYL